MLKKDSGGIGKTTKNSKLCKEGNPEKIYKNNFADALVSNTSSIATHDMCGEIGVMVCISCAMCFFFII